MISPPLFTLSSSPIATLFNHLIFKIFGVTMLVIWFLGLYYLFRSKNCLLYIIVPTYVYFFSIFSWFLLNGRVILCFGIINVIIYSYGFLFLIKVILKLIFDKRFIIDNFNTPFKS
jgi:hypothetical protein